MVPIETTVTSLPRALTLVLNPTNVPAMKDIPEMERRVQVCNRYTLQCFKPTTVLRQPHWNLPYCTIKKQSIC